MLTRPALVTWQASDRSEKFQEAFLAPDYEAIYIPADVRWCYELASLTSERNIDPYLAAKAQRLMVSTNALIHILATAEFLMRDDRANESVIAERLIRRWGLANTTADFGDIRASLRSLSSSVRGFLSDGDDVRLARFFDQVYPGYFGHTLDVPLDTLTTISELLPEKTKPTYWALCYDELEIAPDWLRNELLTALRSASAHVYLKLTWSPLLPSGLRTNPESAADFKAIRLWHSHLADPKEFCDNLTREFLADRLQMEQVDPLSFFSRSILAAEGAEEPPEAYERESTEYEVFKELATWDESLKYLMISRGVNPLDPVPKSVDEKDQFFRKLKPIALLRREFLEKERARSRKAVTLYAGREAIYAMSEGNPRWLLGLLNDLIDLSGAEESKGAAPSISYKLQARVLNNFARREASKIKAGPFRPPNGLKANDADTLFDFVSRIGRFFQAVIFKGDFPLDPTGSFVVPEDTNKLHLALIEQLLDIGAVVYVGSSPQDVPVSIVGSRFRISYILAPVFRLPLRLYRGVSLSVVLSSEGEQGISQIELPL